MTEPTIPNELSLMPTYPGWVGDKSHSQYENLISRIVVSLDGEDVTNRCVAHNILSGYVVVYVRDQNGNFYIENDAVKTEVLHGEVVVKLKDESDPASHAGQ